MADITMPQLGETVTEGTITRWFKQVGDTVSEDEVLFEVSTDKVDSEVPSPAAGVLSEILVAEGDTVDVGTKLAVISAAGSEPAGAPSASSQTADTVPPAQAVAPPEAAAATSAPVAADSSTGEAAEEPSTVATEEVPPAADGRPSPAAEPARSNGRDNAPAQPAPASAETAPRNGDAGRVLSPVVRRLINEHQLDPAQITGTGAGGRITRSDVLAVIDQRNGRGAPAPATAPAPVPAAAPAAAPAPAPTPAAAPVPASAAASAPAPGVAAAPAVTAGERDTIVPFTNIRRRTAEHMVRSKHTSAHTMVAVEVDYSAIEKVRARARTGFKDEEGFSLTFLPFVTRAVVDALREFPNVNSSVGDDALIVHRDLNIGIAVDIDFEGLLVPVIHDADGKRLRMLAREISSLASRARAKRLTMDDISGGTFTITNAGPFGTFITVPVINQPQVAILSTDGVRKKPVVVELPDGSDSIAIHPVGNLVLSWDHRAFDGAYAAAFVARVKEIVESRDWSSEL